MRNRKSNRLEDAYFIHVPKCAKGSMFYVILVLWATCSYRKMWNPKLVSLWKVNFILSFC